MNIPEQINYLNRVRETPANKYSRPIMKRLNHLAGEIDKLEKWVNTAGGHEHIRNHWNPIITEFKQSLSSLRAKFS